MNLPTPENQTLFIPLLLNRAILVYTLAQVMVFRLSLRGLVTSIWVSWDACSQNAPSWNPGVMMSKAQVTCMSDLQLALSF